MSIRHEMVIIRKTVIIHFDTKMTALPVNCVQSAADELSRFEKLQ
jgi:hypothetical protein